MPRTQETVGDPTSPENQTDARWHQTLDALNRTMEAVKAALPNVNPSPNPGTGVKQDRENWTTPENAKRFDDMMRFDYLRLDPKTGKPFDKENFYRPIHVYPSFQTANPSEFVAVFVVEQFRYERQGTEDRKTRQIIASFNMKAYRFEKEFQAVVANA